MCRPAGSASNSVAEPDAEALERSFSAIARYHTAMGEVVDIHRWPKRTIFDLKWGQRAPRSIGTIGGEQPARMTPSPSKPNRWYNAVLAELLDSR
jgi:hypothetical protein